MMISISYSCKVIFDKFIVTHSYLCTQQKSRELPIMTIEKENIPIRIVRKARVARCLTEESLRVEKVGLRVDLSTLENTLEGLSTLRTL